MKNILPKTIEDLKNTEYSSRNVKNEIRENLVRKLSAGEDLFPGVHGFNETVIPQIETAVLSGQDMI